jgi:hypothetical protein
MCISSFLCSDRDCLMRDLRGSSCLPWFAIANGWTRGYRHEAASVVIAMHGLPSDEKAIHASHAGRFGQFSAWRAGERYTAKRMYHSRQQRLELHITYGTRYWCLSHGVTMRPLSLIRHRDIIHSINFTVRRKSTRPSPINTCTERHNTRLQ